MTKTQLLMIHQDIITFRCYTNDSSDLLIDQLCQSITLMIEVVY